MPPLWHKTVWQSTRAGCKAKPGRLDYIVLSHCLFWTVFCFSCCRPSPGTKQMTAATIPSVLKLVDKTLHLHTIISRPNDNHFSCLTYVPSNGSDLPSGLYRYDGMTNYEEGTRTETKQENAKYCPEPPTLNLHEILALCYSESPIPDHEVKTRIPITVDQQPRPISIQL